MWTNLYQQYLDDAAFLFAQRCRDLYDLDMFPEDFVGVEERLAGHLDGLLVAGSKAEGLLEDALAEDDRGEHFVAYLVAMHQPVEKAKWAFDHMVASEEFSASLMWAFALCKSEFAKEWLEALKALKDRAPLQAMLLRAQTLRGEEADDLADALNHDSVVVREAALEMVGRFRLRDHAQTLAQVAASSEDPCADTALQGLIVFDPELARRQALNRAKQGNVTPQVVRVLGAVGGTTEVPVLSQAAFSDDETLARTAILSLGNLGDPEGMDVLLRCVAEDVYPRLAGVSIQRMLGDRLNPDAMIWEEAPPPDEDDPDEDLPLFDISKLRALWDQLRGSYPAGRRIRFGAPLEFQPPRFESSMPHRHDEAWEYAMMEREGHVIETRV